MKSIHYTEAEPIPSERLGIVGAKGLSIRLLVTKEDGAPYFNMVMLVIKPGGHTPDHAHEREEDIFVKSGTGEMITARGTEEVRPGQAIYFGPNEKHQFINTSDDDLELLCMSRHTE